jgi:hypothetical protein
LGFGVFNGAPQRVCRLLKHAERSSKLLVLRRQCRDGGIVPTLPCEQRLQVPLHLVLGAVASIDGRFDPLNRVDARVMRLETEHDVAIDVIDERGVEFLLTRQHPAEQPACAGGKTRFQSAA